MYILLELTGKSLLPLLAALIFLALFVKIGLGLEKYNERIAVVVLCGSISMIALLYFYRHPEKLDELADHPNLTVIGVCVSGVILGYHLLKKGKGK